MVIWSKLTQRTPAYSGVRTFQDKGIARAKAPGLECAGCVRGAARKSVRLEQRPERLERRLQG